MGLWSYAPDWLDWLLIILGVVGLCACIAVIAYQYNGVKTSIGFILDEDLTDDKKAFITSLRHKLENFLLFCAAPFAVFALIVAIIFLVNDPQSFKVFHFTIYIRNGYIFVMCLSFAFAAILFVTYLILTSITAKHFYSETQQSTAKHNRKLAGKIAAFGAIPIAIVILLNIVLTFVFPNGNKTLYKCNDMETFKTHIQTLRIVEGEGAPAGEYYLPLPNELPEDGTECDLGNGFYGVYHYTEFSNSAIQYVSSYWRITYGKAAGVTIDDDGGYIISANVPTWDLYVYGFTQNTYVTNARYWIADHTYYEANHTFDDFGNRPDISIKQYNKTFYLLQDISNTLTDVEIYSFTIVPICTIVIYAVIYITKRKKQKYSF